MRRALIVIDYTNDFVADDGPLTCGKPAQALEGRISQLISEFMDDPDAFVVIANDYHPPENEYHPERKAGHTPHMMPGTPGRELYGEVGRTVKALASRLPPRELARLHWVDKVRFGAFPGTDLELFLRERGVTELHLVGVCTDICVLHTAIDAYNKGFDLVIHVDAVQSFNAAGHEWALGHFKNLLSARLMRSGKELDAL